MSRPIAAALLAAIALACGPVTVTDPDHASVESAIRLSLPVDASNMMLTTNQGLDPIAYTRFHTADGEAWAASQGFPTRTAGVGHFIMSGPPWWQPPTGHTATVGEGSISRGGIYINVQHGEPLDTVWVLFTGR